MKISYYGCIDLASMVAYGGILTDSVAKANTVGASDYSKLSSLDDVVFYFCHDGTSGAECTFTETYLSYRNTPPTQTDSQEYLWGLNGIFVLSITESNLLKSYAN